jgi:signal transduction histidine kinase
MPLPVAKPRILVVEDEIIGARDIKMQLIELGYQPVGNATRGEEALVLAGKLNPNLVLMDIQLAGALDGIETAQLIRQNLALPVVFLTAFAADDVLARAKLTEPFGYILKPFSERELRTVLEMALYKHQADARLRDTAQQLRALSRRVLEVQELERRRVALELHDELGQSLTAIKINLQTHERFKNQSPSELNAENIRIVEEALQQVRRLALALRPSVLDDLGLAPALRWLAEQTVTRGGLVVQVHSSLPALRIAAEIETVCFRVAQEALTNIVRHAKAQRVDIDGRQDGDLLVLSVQDDGCGFDWRAMNQRALAGASIGILGMQERAALVGGQIEIDSAVDRGCTVRFRCPLMLRDQAAGLLPGASL